MRICLLPLVMLISCTAAPILQPAALEAKLDQQTVTVKGGAVAVEYKYPVCLVPSQENKSVIINYTPAEQKKTGTLETIIGIIPAALLGVLSLVLQLCGY